MNAYDGLSYNIFGKAQDNVKQRKRWIVFSAKSAHVYMGELIGLLGLIQIYPF